MTENLHPNTGNIRRVIELGRTVYTRQSLRIFFVESLPEFGGRTPREMINKGQTGAVHNALTATLRNQ